MLPQVLSWIIHSLKKCKKRYQKQFQLRKFNKYNLRQLCFGPLLLALLYYCGDDGPKIRTSSKFFSKNATAWRVERNLIIAIKLYKKR